VRQADIATCSSEIGYRFRVAPAEQLCGNRIDPRPVIVSLALGKLMAMKSRVMAALIVLLARLATTARAAAKSFTQKDIV
jgi:hypothetical protein